MERVFISESRLSWGAKFAHVPGVHSRVAVLTDHTLTPLPFPRCEVQRSSRSPRSSESAIT